MSDTKWDFEGYWNAVLGANRDAGDVAREFDLDTSDRVGLDEWLGHAEVAAAQAGGIPIPEGWSEHHARALDALCD